jgi:hypothetical protein
MEFKIKVSNTGHVYLSKVDPDTEREVTDFCLWRPEWRTFQASESAIVAARTWANNFSEFTGFEIVYSP